MSWLTPKEQVTLFVLGGIALAGLGAEAWATHRTPLRITQGPAPAAPIALGALPADAMPSCSFHSTDGILSVFIAFTMGSSSLTSTRAKRCIMSWLALALSMFISLPRISRIRLAFW